MKRQRKGKKRSSNDSFEETPKDKEKHELVVGLEEISATQKYVPVFGKNSQPKPKMARTDDVQEEGSRDQTTKHVVDEEKADAELETKTVEESLSNFDTMVSGNKGGSSSQTDEPRADKPQTDEPQVDKLQTDELKADEPQTEELKIDEPQTDKRRAVEPQADEPQTDGLQTDEPQTNEPQTDEPQADEPQADEPQADKPQTDEPQPDELQTEEPQVDKHQTNKPQTDKPQTDELQTDEPQTDKPQTDEPQIEEPQVDKYQTDKPQTDKCQTDKPQTDQCQTDKPQTDQCQTDKPQTDQCQTDKPQTDQCQTDKSQTDELQAEELQIDEPQTDKPQIDGTSQLYDKAVKIHMHGYLASTEQAVPTQDEVDANPTCKDYLNANNSKDENLCSIEKIINSTTGLAIIDQDGLDNTKAKFETVFNSVLKLNESECAKAQDTETIDNDDQASKLTETCASKKNEINHTTLDRREGSYCDEEQVYFVEKLAKETAGNKNRIENSIEVNGRQTLAMIALKGEAVDSVLSDKNDQVKDQKYESRRNGTKITDLQDEAEVHTNLIRNKDGVENESLLSNLSRQHVAPRLESLDVNWQKKIDDKSNAPVKEMLPLHQEDEPLIKDDLSRWNISKDGITKIADMQSFLEYDEDAMMTDSQINLLDEDMLMLPQGSVGECEVPVMNEVKDGKSNKTLGDYIADGEHLMKGIIDEISSITKTIVAMKRFIDSTKKQRQTRINMIWKSSKAN